MKNIKNKTISGTKSHIHGDIYLGTKYFKSPIIELKWTIQKLLDKTSKRAHT